ncbi:MAG: M23 family metallopeptidase [Alphaproteobacteria bacterium]|jgi:murein DD-endopeptidase MepM/ murein hydrolase activator NlpD|nr:M23 family metallopeptidase [Alphaproteobacteria bacterium]
MTSRNIAGALILVVFGVTACTNGVMAPVSNKGAYQPAPGGGEIVVAVQGDTVHSVARQYGVSLPSLIAANGLKPPYFVVPGQRLVLPAPERHVVQTGDTLYDISRLYGVDMASLARTNALTAPYLIVPGQALTLPAAARVTTRAPSPGPNAVVEAIPDPAPLAGGRFAWPLQGRVITGFGPQGGGVHNDGINIQAPSGAPVLAAENGVIAYAGNELPGLGNLLLIRHSDGWVTAYAHNGQILVQRGDQVTRGQMIATAGATGSVLEPQLHFEIRLGTEAVNPLEYLDRQLASLRKN